MTIIAPQKNIAPTQAPNAKRIDWLFITKVVALQLAAILAVEVFFYLNGIGEEEIFKFDKEIGFKHMSDKRITWRSEGFAQSYFDKDGMREPGLTVEKPAGTLRVALLGDSMVEGLQVPIQDTFGQMVQKTLQAEGKPVQVLNFATSGYSTVQQYLQLKNKVMKYKPDLVLMFYSNRDMFENWASDNTVVTNIRPSAVHLPKGYLFFDNSMVRRWMRSPRGKFLTSIDWVREHSRIWGVWSALELEMSMNNPMYKVIITAFTSPKQAIAEFGHALSTLINTNQPTWQINFFEQTGSANTAAATTKLLHKETVAATEIPAVNTKLNSAAPNVVLANNPEVKKMAAAVDGQSVYKSVVVQTLTSLTAEMKNYCNQNGVKFAVVTLPSRAELAPAFGMDTAFCGIDYKEEVALMKGICSKLNIPLQDCESAAERLPESQRIGMFYTVHLSPAGQHFMTNQLGPFVRNLVAK